MDEGETRARETREVRSQSTCGNEKDFISHTGKTVECKERKRKEGQAKGFNNVGEKILRLRAKAGFLVERMGKK